MRKLLLLLLIPAAILAHGEIKEGNVINSDFIYHFMKLEEAGLKKEIFDKALAGWNKLSQKNVLNNPYLLTIADYSQSSNKKRLYVIDLFNQKLLFNTYVAHGKNTGEEFADSFSNKIGSLQSSLGFYITSYIVQSPKHGTALLLNGIEKGINDNALKREIIIHGADYVSESFIQEHGRLGRSFGCPALPRELNESIIQTIHSGSCLFLYFPDKKYLKQSPLLN